MIQSPRLIPAVILGAMSLLALKLLAWTSEPYPGRVPASAGFLTSSAPAKAAGKPADREGGGRAHGPGVLFDPETTGAIDAPKGKASSESKVSPEEQAKRDAAMAANPANKAELMNRRTQPPSPSERALLERLGERRDEIEARMRELDMREKLLDNAEKRLDGRVDDLKALEQKADGPQQKNEEAAKALKNLVIMYETMKPKDAARVFDRLSLDVLVPVVRQMNPRKMSDVLAAMSSEAAEKLTVALSQPGRANLVVERVAPAGLGGNELPAIEPAARR